MSQNLVQINETISNYLKSNKPFSVLRLDNTAGYIIHCLSNRILPSGEFWNVNTLVEANVVPSTLEYHSNVVIAKTAQLMEQCDILGFVDVSGDISRDSNFLSHFANKPVFCNSAVMDPGALLGHSEFGDVIEHPWTEHLAGKKVLVISSHANSIKEQWKNIDKIWGQNRNKIAPFELVDAISTPYHPAIDNRQYENCNNFEDLVRITQDRIDQYDYDVLLTGVTTQSPFYAEHAKQRGKVGIQTGGTIQLFFGLLGGRWAHLNVPGYRNWSKMYNEYWQYPLEIDQPQAKNKIQFLETAIAYWR